MSRTINGTIRELRSRLRSIDRAKSPTLPYQVYLDHRKDLFRLAIENGRAFEKLMILISSGAIALSIAFLKDIVGDNPMKWPAALLIGWGLLVIALGFTLLSIYLSMEASYDEIDSLDESFENEERCGPNWKAIWCKKLDFTAIVLILIGLGSMCLFVFNNIGSADGK